MACWVVTRRELGPTGVCTEAGSCVIIHLCQIDSDWHHLMLGILPWYRFSLLMGMVFFLDTKGGTR